MESKYGTNQQSMKQKQTHRYREQTCGCEGAVVGKNGSLGLTDANYYI